MLPSNLISKSSFIVKGESLKHSTLNKFISSPHAQKTKHITDDDETCLLFWSSCKSPLFKPSNEAISNQSTPVIPKLPGAKSTSNSTLLSSPKHERNIEQIQSKLQKKNLKSTRTISNQKSQWNNSVKISTSEKRILSNRSMRGNKKINNNQSKVNNNPATDKDTLAAIRQLMNTSIEYDKDNDSKSILIRSDDKRNCNSTSNESGVHIINNFEDCLNEEEVLLKEEGLLKKRAGKLKLDAARLAEKKAKIRLNNLKKGLETKALSELNNIQVELCLEVEKELTIMEGDKLNKIKSLETFELDLEAKILHLQELKESIRSKKDTILEGYIEYESQLWRKNTQKLKEYQNTLNANIVLRLNQAATSIGFELNDK